MMPNNNTYIIAEAGVNHNGRIDLAEKLIQSAASIGADAIKFQTFQTNKIVHPKAQQAEYQLKNSKNTNNQYDLLKNLELTKEQFIYLKNIADLNKIEFLSTPFDMQSLNFLVDLGLPIIKISSGDLTYGPLLLKAAQSNRKVFLSTGMATLEEIRVALFVLVFGYENPTITPKSFKDIFDFATSTDWKKVIHDKVTLFHCTSEYPAPFNEINLNVLDTFKEEFGVNVGYSDHSLGIKVPSLAIAKGAKIIEKHITLDNFLEGPDHKASLNIQDFAEMIKEIRLTESILGNFEKCPTPSELKNKEVVRRGIYTTSQIKEGDHFNEDSFLYLRPATQFSPMKAWDIIGRKAQHNYDKLDPYND